MITYQIEKSETWDAEKQAIVAECWEEIGHGSQRKIMPTPNLESYGTLERQGLLIAVTMRDDGKLIGYCTMFLVGSTQHPGHKKVVSDSIYVRKDKRGPMTGINLILHAEKLAKEAGAVESDFFVTMELDFGRLLEKLDYQLTAKVYSKVL